ncbi:MAG: protein kinase [Acidobacteriia bacterium]|nr:protein kinase [Terriglobia bacterium]
MIGKSISHYRILEKLGGGGMGVVYKAEDTKLGRMVALKVLPPERVADPNRKRRFVQEARAASALNHPNIITIYDIDEAEGVHYIAMECVEGKTLDRLIARHGLRVNEALKYAVQMATALAKAHSAGIVHRDLKPTNVMVTDDGLVKVLDFGLAKLTEAAPTGDAETAVTLEPTTEEGTIVGTVGYMSPEQAEGKPVDARSDIFSFGSVLYEMLTGQRAFQGETKVSTIAAILREEPKPLSQVVEGLPREVERIVRRCLRKDPAHRFQHMDDLKVALEELKEESDSGELADTAAAVGAGLARPREGKALPYKWAALAAIVVIVVALGVAGWFWFRRSRATLEAPLTPVPLTSYPGYEAYPSFSPDGTQVAFQWCPEGHAPNCDIYVKQIGVEPPSRLTTDPAEDFSPAWSPDGKFIAFLRKVSTGRTALMLIPQRGGQERVLGESDITYITSDAEEPYGSYLAWTPDSKWLVLPWRGADKPDEGLFLLNVETRETRRLTTAGDNAPAFSPDGRTLAFNRGGNPDLICFLRLTKDYQPEGGPERVAPAAESYDRNFGTAWTADGRDIVFSSGNWASTGLWRVAASAGAKPRRLAFASDGASAPAVSRQGNRLAYVVNRTDANIWRVDLRSPGQNPGIPARLIASTREERDPAYSPDGKRIAFMSSRSGACEIWMSASDGSNPVQLTAFGGPIIFGPKWSPDGQNIAFTAARAGTVGLYVVSANGGPPRRLTTHPAGENWPYWSRDGQSVYFRSNRTSTGDIWKMPAKGGEAVQITRHGGDAPQESPDGRLVYYEKGYPSQCSVWKVPAAGGEEVKVLDSTHSYGGWTVGEQGIYFFTPPDGQGRSDICLYRFATGQTSRILAIERNVGYRIAVSPDERTILYGQFDQAGSDLMLVENFR